MNNSCQLSMQRRVTIGKILCNRAEDLHVTSFFLLVAVKAETGAEAFKLLEPTGDGVSNR